MIHTLSIGTNVGAIALALMFSIKTKFFNLGVSNVQK